jgi:integrase
VVKRSALSRGALRAPKPTTIAEAWNAWYKAARDGTIRNRSGDRFKPSALRAYEGAMRLRVLPKLGYARLSDLRCSDLQAFADGFFAQGLSPYLQVTLLPIRALVRHALAREQLAANPCSGLQLPRFVDRGTGMRPRRRPRR